jgi:hypothetical protein
VLTDTVGLEAPSSLPTSSTDPARTAAGRRLWLLVHRRLPRAGPGAGLPGRNADDIRPRGRLLGRGQPPATGLFASTGRAMCGPIRGPPRPLGGSRPAGHVPGRPHRWQRGPGHHVRRGAEGADLDTLPPLATVPRPTPCPRPRGSPLRRAPAVQRTGVRPAGALPASLGLRGGCGHSGDECVRLVGVDACGHRPGTTYVRPPSVRVVTRAGRGRRDGRRAR